MTEKSPINLIRKQYFIDRKFQLVFMLKFIVVILLGGLLSVGITLMTTESTLTSSFVNSRLVIEKTSLAILPSVVLTNIITTFVVIILAIIVTLLISHKIAGPMFRIATDLEEIAQGNLQKTVKTRKDDQFSSMTTSLNAMVTNLNEKLSEVQQELDKISELASAQQLPQSFIDDLKACRMSIESKFKL